eukprot:11158197-Lingulodinium_polyedra.AAC.1
MFCRASVARRSERGPCGGQRAHRRHIVAEAPQGWSFRFCKRFVLLANVARFYFGFPDARAGPAGHYGAT